MSEPDRPARGVHDEPAQRPPAQPEQTSDDTDLGWGEVPDSELEQQQTEQWLRAQRPPHWE